jgi:N-acetylneuraminate epimerase
MVQFEANTVENVSRHSMKWEVAGVLPGSSGAKKHLGLAGSIVGIHKNILIIGGGANFPDKKPWFGGEKRYHDDIFIFQKDERGKIGNYGKTYKLPFPIAYGASCNTPQGIVCAGGENNHGLSNKVLMIKWDDLVNNISFTNLPPLPFAVANAGITSIGNCIYIAGGELADGVSDVFLTLDLDDISKGWKNMPKLPYQVSHSVMLSLSNGINNCIYFIGGRKRNQEDLSTLYSSVFQYDLKINVWAQKESLPYSLSAGTGVLALDGKSIFLFGGDEGETFHKAESLITAINHETDPLKRDALNLEKIIVQTNHPGFSRTVLEYNIQENRFFAIDSIQFDTPVTTTAVVWEDRIVIPSGEIKAGIRTPNILSAQFK